MEKRDRFESKVLMKNICDICFNFNLICFHFDIVNEKEKF